MRLTQHLSHLVIMLLGTGLFNSLLCHASPAMVELVTPNQSLNVEIEPHVSRLSQVFDHYQAHMTDFPYGLIWFRPALKAEQQQQQQQLEEALRQHRSSAKKPQIWESLLAQAEQLTVTGRMVEPVNMDRVYAAASDNYLVQHKDSFVVPGKPEHIWLWGLIEGPIQLPHKPLSDIRDYLQQLTFLPSANRDTVTIIEPNTETTTAPIAYWNHQSRYLSPGSIVYIGLSPQWLNDDYEQINQLFIQRLQSQTLGLN